MSTNIPVSIKPYITIGEAAASPITIAQAIIFSEPNKPELRLEPKLNDNPPTYEIQKSKFIAYVSHIESEMDARQLLQKINKKHFDARHAPYAWVIGEDELTLRQKTSDDGEPSGTAGMPILEIIKNNELTNILVVVVRYFGGIKLGAGGLIRAYAQSAAIGIKKAPKIQMTPLKHIDIIVGYDLLSTLEHFIHQNSLISGEIAYTDSVKIPLLVEPTRKGEIIEKIIDLTAGIAKINEQDVNLIPIAL